MRKRYHLLLLSFLVTLALAIPALAGQKSERIYLPADTVDAVHLIGPPPAHDSEEFRTQMAIVLWLQKTRIPEQVAFAGKAVDLQRFAPLISTSLVNAGGRLRKETLNAVIGEFRTDYDARKAVFDEPRHFQSTGACNPWATPGRWLPITRSCHTGDGVWKTPVRHFSGICKGNHGARDADWQVAAQRSIILAKSETRQ